MGKSRKLADLGGSEAVKLWSGLFYCIMYLFKGGQVHLQYMIQIIQMKPFKGLTKIQILHCFYFVAVPLFTKS